MANYTWFFLGMVGPFLYALTNHIDKHLLEKYFKEDGVMTLIIYSAVLSLALVPVAYWMSPTSVLGVSHENMLVLAGVAFIDVILLWAYLKAMEGDEPTVVIVFYQLVPVLGLVSGYFILGETITTHQLGAMAVVMVGTSLVSFEKGEGFTFKLKARTVGYMLIACTCWALETTIFKKVALEEDAWRSIFWEHSALGVVGLGIFAFNKKARHGFLKQFRENSVKIVGLNALNEVIYMTGNVAVAFASLMAPVAVILLMNAYQPIFVMAIGILLARFFPKLATEKMSRGHLVQRVIAIAITGVGTYLLLQSGVEV